MTPVRNLMRNFPRRPFPASLPLLLVAALLAIAISGCTDSEQGDGIDPAAAGELDAQLTLIAESVDAGECLIAREQAREFVEMVNALPASAGVTVKQQLRRAGRQLQEIVLSPTECEPDTVSPDPVEPVDNDAPTGGPTPPGGNEQPGGGQPSPDPGGGGGGGQPVDPVTPPDDGGDDDGGDTGGGGGGAL